MTKDMAPDNRYNDFMQSLQGRTFTFSEAIEVMKIFDNFPTGQNTIDWVSSRTGRPVAIGYNPYPERLNAES